MLRYYNVGIQNIGICIVILYEGVFVSNVIAGIRLNYA